MKKSIFHILVWTIAITAVSAAIIRGGFWETSTAYAVGDITINWGVPAGNPIFTVTAAAPGQVESRNVVVTNNAAIVRPLGVRGTPVTVDPALGSALKMQISSGATVLYGAGGSKTLAQFFADSAMPDGVSLLSLNPGQTATLTFTVTFDAATGNAAQGAQAVFNITLGIVTTVPQECTGITFAGAPIFGTAKSDSIRGTAGNDLIFGLEGSDSIRGLGGDDCIVGGPGSDSLRGGLGKDEMYGNEGSDSLRGEENDDTLFGGEGSDDLRGEDGNDQAFGEAGNDSLRGGDGNDSLTGGAGEDSARGEDGTDTCVAESKRTCEL